MVYLGYVLATIWGVFWALFLEWVPLGQFLVRKRTWITVAIGVGVDLAIAALVVEPAAVGRVLIIVALSSVGIVGRSLANERRDTLMLLRGMDDHGGGGGDKDEAGE